MNKEIKQLIRLVQGQKWKVRVRNNGHMVWKSPDPNSGPIYTSQTPSDYRAIERIKSQLRKAGANV